MPSSQPPTTDLQGLRILVTRPESQARDFITQLTQAGARPLLLPTIKIIPPPDWSAADRAISELADYHWLILSSVNGFDCFYQRLQSKGLDALALDHLTTICVGPKTAQAAAISGLKSNLIAKEFAAEGIIELFAGLDIRAQKILLPRALQARELLPETLRRRGARVDVVPVYETIFPPESAAQLNHLLAQEEIDIITVTSASSASNLIQHCHSPQIREKLKSLPTACIGPITAAAATAAGLNVRIIANEYTAAGLLDALKKYYRNAGIKSRTVPGSFFLF
ncbi:MAG: uroporphyrinogen-III synthase [Deltaproteobacteria bacterium]|nr:uroporphyrinogen-III synthase [Deltaproteobacteria bacterium]